MSLRNPPSSSTHGRILLVDDNANGLSARKSVLEELGHRISAVRSAADALEHFAQQRYDLVVTDYKMPHMDGLELIKQIRKLSPEMPIVLLSGYVDALGLNEGSTGADAVIQKSANEVSHLLRAVSRLLRRKPLRKSAASELPKSKRKAV